MGPMRRSRVAGTVAGWLVAAALAAPGLAQEAGRTVVERGTVREDLYLAGGRVDVLATVEGDVVAAGGRVRLGRDVRGDVLAAGGDVTVEGRVADDVRVAGGLVTLRAEVGGDVTAVGGSVTLPPEATVRGKAWLAGGEVDARGRVGGWLRAAARTVRLGGEIGGDVHVVATTVEVLPGTRIRGALVYRSLRPAAIPPGVEIAGGVRHEPADVPEVGRVLRGVGLALVAATVGGVLPAGAVLGLLFPGLTAASAAAVRRSPWRSLGVGFATLVAAPAAGVVLVATVVGAPVGLALLALYAVAVLAGLLVGATCLGALGTRLFRREPTRGRVVATTLTGVVALALLQLVPVAGALLAGLALVLGLGGMTLHGYRVYGAGA